MLAISADVNCISKNGKTALHYAVEQNSLPSCQLLVLKNAKTHSQDAHNKDTPLHFAIKNRCDPHIQALLIRHATRYRWGFFWACSALNCQDLLGDTPLHLAVKTSQFEAARLLIGKGAKTDLKNQDGKTVRDLMRRNHLQLPTNLSAWLRQTETREERQRAESSCSIM